MPDRTDRLDERIDQALADPRTMSASGDGELDSLVGLAVDLVDLPRDEFRTNLAVDLERSAAMSSTVSYIPEGLTAVTPYLNVRDSTAAIAFYKDVFGATEMMRHEEGGAVVHAKLRIGGSAVEIGEHTERPTPKGDDLPPVGMHLYVEDVDAVLAKATTAGGRVLHPIQDQPYGDREVSIADPFGVVWFVATHLHD
ncbi:MAG: VOC family protein [Acidimicrobiia bacterium]